MFYRVATLTRVANRYEEYSTNLAPGTGTATAEMSTARIALLVVISPPVSKFKCLEVLLVQATVVAAIACAMSKRDKFIIGVEAQWAVVRTCAVLLAVHAVIIGEALKLRLSAFKILFHVELGL